MSNIPDKLPPTNDPRCGTYPGHAAHYQRKEYPCPPCRQARALYKKKWDSANHERVTEAIALWSAKNPEKRKAARTRYRAKHPEKIAAQKRRYRKTHPGQAVDSNARYRLANREKLAASKSLWCRENQEKIAEYHRTYSLENPEKIRKKFRKRRARKLNAPSEPYATQDILNLYGTDCHICKKAIDLEAPKGSGRGQGWQFGLHLDHLISLASGGTDLIENVRPSHAICNLKKGST